MTLVEFMDAVTLAAIMPKAPARRGGRGRAKGGRDAEDKLERQRRTAREVEQRLLRARGFDVPGYNGDVYDPPPVQPFSPSGLLPPKQATGTQQACCSVS